MATLHKLAGKPAPAEILEDIPALLAAYDNVHPDPSKSEQRVSFGTSGHRGTSLSATFNDDHISAVCQAVCEFRIEKGIDGPLYLAKDTHALSEPAFKTAIEVFAANGVNVVYQSGFGFTPTPVISHAILTFNRNRKSGLSDGVIITPSHNPPSDGGIKYNCTNGGPAEDSITRQIENRANELLESKLADVKRIPFDDAIALQSSQAYDYITPYVDDLESVIDMQVIADADLKIGVDPLGGSGIAYWEPIAKKYGLNIEVVNTKVDPAFSFMTVDKDGKIRMDCSSPYAMASLIELKDSYDIAMGNDPDFDRHGIVTPSGLMNPNHYLAVAIQYLFENRPQWGSEVAIGKTLVSSSMIDRVAAHIKRKLVEVPVGFKWFVDGLFGGTLGFGGEESAGASFLRKDGTVWSTDKDGFILALLAAEITAKTKQDPSIIYRSLEDKFGSPIYQRIDAPASPDEKAKLKSLSPSSVTSDSLAGEPITEVLTEASGNGAAIGGLKVVTENGWFAARPSGTENIYKIYAESFLGESHLKQLQVEAQDIVSRALSAAD